MSIIRTKSAHPKKDKLETSASSDEPDQNSPKEWTESGLYLIMWSKLSDVLRGENVMSCIDIALMASNNKFVSSVTIGPPIFEAYIQAYVSLKCI